MIGTQRIAAQWLCWAAVAYISYRLMLIAEAGGDSNMLFLAIHFLVLWAIVQRPEDLEALADAAESA